MIHKATTVFIACVWLINGLYCKLLGFVPRHEQIVQRILGPESSGTLTRFIGIGEIVIGLWTLVGYYRKQNAFLQIALVLLMNLLEFFLASDLLMWGRWNLIFAFIFTGLVLWWGLKPMNETER